METSCSRACYVVISGKAMSGPICPLREPVIFDSGGMYAHNELQFGIWRADIHDLEKLTCGSAFNTFPQVSQLRNWDYRNRLYSIKYLLSYCLCWPATAPNFRKLNANRQVLDLLLTSNKPIRRHSVSTYHIGRRGIWCMKDAYGSVHGHGLANI